MNRVLQQAKKLVIPTRKLQHKKNIVAKTAIELVRNQVTKYSEVTSIEFGGSYAKETWLPDKADIDIFIKFKESVTEKKFADIGKKIGFESLKEYSPYIRYSEHPYVEAKINNTKVNVVPCYDVKKGKWQSSADRSPFHTKFMLESLTGIMKEEVRMLKKFLLANRIYGSEIAKQGFSGYVAEVLVWHYGSFLNVINEMSNLKPDTTIGKSTKKFETSIIIMDPIDSNRNLGAAISTNNVGKFVIASRAFMKKPSIKFFNEKQSKNTKKKFENVLVVEFDYKPRSPDIIWGQVKRAANALSTQLRIEEFKVLQKNAVITSDNNASLLFFLQSLKIEENQVREGPDFFGRDNSEKFMNVNAKKSKSMWISDNGKIISLQKRSYNDAKIFLQNLLKKNLNKSGIPNGLKSDFKKGFKIIDGSKVRNKLIKMAIIEMVSTDETLLYSSK